MTFKQMVQILSDQKSFGKYFRVPKYAYFYLSQCRLNGLKYFDKWGRVESDIMMIYKVSKNSIWQLKAAKRRKRNKIKSTIHRFW